MQSGCDCERPKERPVGYLTEGKSYGTRRSFSDEKSMLMNALVRLVGSLKGNLDQKLIKDSINAYDDLKGEFKDALFGILDSYQAGEITVDEFEKMIQTEIRNAWSSAYDLGVGSAGNPFGVYDEDKTWLKGARAEEYGYLGGFADALDTDEFVMDPEKRMGMYVDTLDGIFNHGQVDGHPDYVDIYWELGDSEHCFQCLELAANSPYTKDSLPSVPGDGSTVCLCITTPSSRVLTNRGWIPIAEVLIGDLVLTHKNRWKRVLAIPKNPSGPLHKQAYIRGMDGQLVGCTDTHRFLTKQGWGSIALINKRGLAISVIKSEADPQIILLSSSGRIFSNQGVLPEGTTLYDLTVEDDHSFIIEGLITHNSNCQCSLRYEISDRAPEAMAVKIPEAPGMKAPSVPEGYRLPTYAEYEAISSMQSEAERLKGLAAATTGDLKKDLIQQRTDIVHEYTSMIDTNNLYFVPKSNYYQGAFGSDIGESTEVNGGVQIIPNGYRSASLKEKNRIDAMASDIDHLRKFIANGRKDLIAKRHLLNEQMLSYMERHKIYYIPRGLFGEMIAERSKVLLIEQESKDLINDLFGARM